MVSESDTMISLPVVGDLRYREWHALVDGLFCGYNHIHETEYTKEKHYWRVGWLVGDYYGRHF